MKWGALARSGVDKQAPVVLRLHGVKFSTVLDFLLDETGDGKLGYRIDQGVIVISTIDDLRAPAHVPTTGPAPR